MRMVGMGIKEDNSQLLHNSKSKFFHLVIL